MKKYIFLTISISISIFGCSVGKGVYWCGDHPCISNKEKEAYFKKTMIVETKSIKKESYKGDTEIEKLMKEAQIKEKKRIINEKALKKQTKLDEKRRHKEEKKLAKQIRLEEKKRQKEEKKLLKKAKDDKKKQKKLLKKSSKTKKISKKVEKELIKEPERKIVFDTGVAKVKIDLNKFNELVENITEKNKNKPYPSINNIQN